MAGMAQQPAGPLDAEPLQNAVHGAVLGGQHRLPDQGGRHPAGKHRDVVDYPEGSDPPVGAAEEVRHQQRRRQHQGDIEDDILHGIAQGIPELLGGQDALIVGQAHKVVLQKIRVCQSV